MTASCGQAVAHLRSPCESCAARQPNYDCAARCETRLAYLAGQKRDTRFDTEMKAVKKLAVAMCPDHPEMPQKLDYKGAPTGACELCLQTARPASAGAGGGAAAMRVIVAPKGNPGRPRLKKPAEFSLTLDFTARPDLWQRLLESAGKNIRSLEEQALFCLQTGLATGEEEKPRAVEQTPLKKIKLPKHLQDATPAVIQSYRERNLCRP